MLRRGAMAATAVVGLAVFVKLLTACATPMANGASAGATGCSGTMPRISSEAGIVCASVHSPNPWTPSTSMAGDTAVGSDQGRTFVYVVGPDEKVMQRPVVLGPLENGMRIVREGLSANDRVVINGLMAIRAGSTVKAEESPMELPSPTPATPAAKAP